MDRETLSDFPDNATFEEEEIPWGGVVCLVDKIFREEIFQYCELASLAS